MIEACSGMEALEKLEQDDFDCVLLDHLMPGLSGLEVLKIIRKLHSPFTLPIILVTALYDKEVVVEAIQHGADDYINKPYDVEVLKARVSAHLLRKQLSDELVMAKTNAELASKAKAECLASMSHEIRTPMNAVAGMIHLALQTGLDEQQKNYIGKAYQSSQNLLGILNDILDVSKIEAGKLELEETVFRLHSVIDDLVNLVKYKVDEKRLRLAVKIEQNVPRLLRGDPLRLSQVLINLVNNAVKFTQEEGSVTLQVSLDEESGDDVILHFSVIDTGIGLSPNQQERLFQAFTQADISTTREYGGTGLGLMISSKLTQLMKGALWVESQEQNGSTFHFTVKLKKQLGELASSGGKASGREIQGADQAKELLQGARILLVEDNDLNSELAMELLSMCGIIVEAAENGIEALALLENGEFDGVLMDCQMPVMDGYDATRKIREQDKYKHLPVIAMTANAMKGDRDRVLAVGMNDHIAKPFDPDEMYVTLARWIKAR